MIRLRSLLRAGVLTLLAAGYLPGTTVSVTIASLPIGQAFTVDGVGCTPAGYTTPQALVWTAGANCTVTFASPQNPQNGTRLIFSGWQDAPAANPRTIAAPGQTATYTAAFTPQFLVTATAVPSTGGVITGGDWYTAGSTATLSAAPAAGYRLAGWSPPIVTPSGATSATVVVNSPLTATAALVPNLPGPPGSYAVSQVAANSVASAINSYGQVAGNSASSAFLWTPVAANGTVGNMVDLGGLVISGANNNVGGLNDRGQVAGTTVPLSGGSAQGFLWSPDTPNAATGGITAFLGSAPATSLAINNIGQIAGSPPGFIWTPSAPNGTTGTVNADTRLAGIRQINDYGQAMVNSGTPSLFTPSAANGASGSFTTISAPSGAVNTQLVAINRTGVIAGTTCAPSGGTCNPTAFLWTPTTPNGTTGSAVAIPLPAGYVSMIPAALNAAGQLVGTMLQSSAAPPTPFLYAGGTVYDLSVLGSQLAFGAPAGINDLGQIAVNTPTGAYLVTPGITPPTPGPGTVAITVASAAVGSITPIPQAFTVAGTGCSAGGYNTPQTLYWLPGSSCTVTFLSPHSAQIGTRYLFNAWQDGPVANPRVFVAPSQPAAYTASFTAQYLLTALANPPEGGAVTGGGWFANGNTATLTAVPAAGYKLLDWTPAIAAPGSATAIVPVPFAQTVTANFALISATPPGNYLVTQIAVASAAGNAKPINNFGQVVGNNSPGAFLWTPVAANSPVGNLADLGGLPIGVTPSNIAAGINDLGQVIGTTSPQSSPIQQLFLWSPNAPNGTSGTLTAFLGTTVSVAAGPSTVFGINSYGQIVGIQNGSPFLWTPSSPNGSTGAANMDGRFNGIVAINDYGQAIMTGTLMLSTPSTANGSTGNFTSVSGLPGAIGNQLIAIANDGTILGTSCLPVAGAGCSSHGFLVRENPRGVPAAAQEIPLPSGFVSMNPAAINASNQVIGTIARADGIPIPFLYSGTSLYDLTTLSGQLRGAIPVGLNDRGQIAVNASGIVYLLTPGAAPPPPPQGSVPVTITADSPLEPFTVTGAGCSPGGYVAPQTLSWIPGSSCTVTMVSPHSPTIGTRFVFSGWQDAVTTNPRVFVAPSQPVTYSATSSLQFFLSTAANPPAGGTVSGGGWYSAGTTATVTASAAAGYRLLDWTPFSLAAPGASSATVTMYNPQSVTVNFALVSALPPGNYQITQISAAAGAFAPSLKPINNFGQVVENSGPSAYLWTPVAANSTSGNLTQVVGFSNPIANTFDNSAGINDQGQVVGITITNPSPLAFLWSPNTANGTTGAAVAYLGSGSGVVNPPPVEINSYGQIGGLSYLWTPSSPNGTTGSVNSDSRMNSLRAINSFGQAIMNTTPLTPTLFTPSTAHGSTGVFTPVFGLAGAINTALVDINGNGTIVGSSCIPVGVGTASCANHLFLWTPSTPNGTSGTAVEIPLPSGIVSMSPTALNAAGQIVGNMTQSTGVTVPFLYAGGAIYDLSLLGSQLRGGTAAGINDAGQIVINNFPGVVWLVTPQAAAPAPAGANPAAGSGASQTFTFSFSDPRGWQDLGVVNILINDFLDARNACYLAYSQPLSALYLVNDAGLALLPGLSNSQCAITAFSASGTGNTLTLTVSLSFSTSFGGNRIFYMAARDVVQNNSGWQALGTWGVPGAAAGPTAAVSVNPAHGNGLSHSFTFTFTDVNGWPDLGVVDILINSSLDGKNACYLAYSRPYNALYLVNDAGTTILPGLSNSQCSITGFSAAMAGITLTLNLTATFPLSFAGNQIVYMAARDNGDVHNSGWQALGTWTVQ